MESIADFNGVYKRGIFKSAEHKKALSEAASFFVWSPSSLGSERGEQPLSRGSSASKSLALFWYSFVRAKEYILGGDVLCKRRETLSTRLCSTKKY